MNRLDGYSFFSVYWNLENKKSKVIIEMLAGYRNTNGSFNNRGTNAYIWSSLESGTNAWVRKLYSGFATVNRGYYDKADGFSVRCLKDWFDYFDYFVYSLVLLLEGREENKF